MRHGLNLAIQDNMRQKVLAFDYDGTIAEEGKLPTYMVEALRRLHLEGCALFLVTGRRYASVDLGPVRGLFRGVVWENGAVLDHTGTGEIYMPFGYIEPPLWKALESAGVELEHGLAIVSTWDKYEEEVWQVIQEWGGDVALAHNKGALMILPPGTAKGPGLERMLDLCGFSPRDLASFGDGENDLSMFEVSALGLAVANAVPSLQEAADLVTKAPGPEGVLEAMQRYWLNGEDNEIRPRREYRISLGEDEKDVPLYFPVSQLVEGNLGVFGDSMSGKSWVTGLLTEGMHHAGYQLLLIDPEGDFRGFHTLPRVIALSGDRATLPAPTAVAAILEKASISVVLDLCDYPKTDREDYLTELFRILKPLRENRFRPHWTVLEEAQNLLPPGGNRLSAALEPMLSGGGWAFVSFRPDRLPRSILNSLNYCLLARLEESEAARVVCQQLNIPQEKSPASIPHGSVWLCGESLIRLRPSPRRILHIRHLYKYLDKPLPQYKRFYFRDKEGFLDLEAANLYELMNILPSLPLGSLEYHMGRGDFAVWTKSALGDEELAAQIKRLGREGRSGEKLREVLLGQVKARYAEIQASGSTLIR